MVQKHIKIQPNQDFPEKSQYEWIMYMNDTPELINNFYFECPCYSALNEDKTKPTIIVLASEVLITEDLGKKLVNLK